MTLDYGLIGNCKTAALVSRKGAIEWCCLPRFDSSSAFAKILDEKRGGSFEIVPVGKYAIEQRYLPSTNILETSFRRETDEFMVYDFFPRFRSGEKIEKLLQINRYIRVVRGSPRVRVIFNPRFNYARGKTSVRIVENHITARQNDDLLFLYSDLDLSKIFARKPVKLVNEHYLMASYKQHLRPSIKMVKLLFAKTRSYWQEFVKFSTLPPIYKKQVTRSILALKLMTHEAGAIIAAPTTSLPEIVGDARNWDYRYCWLRDSSFTLDALTKICHFDEAEAFLEWLTKICLHSRKDLQIVYKVDGGKTLREKILPHLSGYKNSRPVRIGNHAYVQKQRDVYGWLIESFYLFYLHYNYSELELKHWKVVQKLVSTVINRWREKDSGLWEFRGFNDHFTFSKLMCWVAMDRGVKIAKKRREAALVRKWAVVRDEIKNDIMKNAWNPETQSFVQRYGSDIIDASNLLMPYFGFIPATHPKMRKTIEATKKHLTSGCYVFRYVVEDDFGKPKNAFTICTFWLIDALYMVGEKGEAQRLFKRILKHGNYLGLFSEDINPGTGELTGNFPQAYTHLAIVNTAILLSSGQIRRPMCHVRLEMLQD